jgi:hypothetical protein
MSSSALKSSFLAKTTNGAAKEEMPAQLMPGFIKITLLIKPAHLIKHTAVIMALGVRHRLSAEIALLSRDVGRNKEPKFTESKNMVMSVVKQTS